MTEEERIQIRLRNRIYYAKNKVKLNSTRRSYYKENHLKFSGWRHSSEIKKKFNMSVTDYNNMFISQNGCCAICGIHQSKITRRLCVDHDHSNGNVRGLLCGVCNTRLGHIENKEFCLKATLYLKNFEKSA